MDHKDEALREDLGEENRNVKVDREFHELRGGEPHRHECDEGQAEVESQTQDRLDEERPPQVIVVDDGWKRVDEELIDVFHALEESLRSRRAEKRWVDADETADDGQHKVEETDESAAVAELTTRAVPYEISENGRHSRVHHQKLRESPRENSTKVAEA